MRRVLFSVLVLALAILLGACQDGSDVVVPTAAQLPTATATEEVFITPTPDITATVPPDTPTPRPTVLPSPTPETELEPAADAPAGPCSAAALREKLAQVNLNALRSNLDVQMSRIREAAGTLGDWALSGDPDPLAGVGAVDALPLASLRYRREGSQEAFLLVSLVSGPLRGYYTDCMEDEAYYKQGDVTEDAVVSVELLNMGAQAALARIVQPAEAEMSDTGITELETYVYTMLVGETLVQYVNIPALDELTGMAAVSREDAFALLNALAGAIHAP